VLKNGILWGQGSCRFVSLSYTQVYGFVGNCGNFIMNSTSEKQVKMNVVLYVIAVAQGSTG